MDYILYALLALVCSAGNTIFNRLASNKINVFLSMVLKSFFIVLTSFIIVLSLGHLDRLFYFDIEQLIYLCLTCLLTLSNWLFYFKAIKSAHLEAFSPFMESSQLFFTNALFFVFQFLAVTQKGKTLSIILYSLGLVALLVALIYITFNKKINPKTNKMWLIYAAFSAFSLASANIIVNLKLSCVPSDIIGFYQLFFVFFVSAIICIFTKKISLLKTLRWQDYFRFFIAGIFNTGLILFRYKALSVPNTIPSIVTVIIASEFILVSVYSIIFYKANNRKQAIILTLIVLFGMSLHVISGVI